MISRHAEGRPNDQWNDVRQFPRGDPRTILRMAQAMLDNARDEYRTAKAGTFRDSTVAIFAGGKVEAFGECLSMLEQQLKQK